MIDFYQLSHKVQRNNGGNLASHSYFMVTLHFSFVGNTVIMIVNCHVGSWRCCWGCFVAYEARIFVWFCWRWSVPADMGPSSSNSYQACPVCNCSSKWGERETFLVFWWKKSYLRSSNFLTEKKYYLGLMAVLAVRKLSYYLNLIWHHCFFAFDVASPYPFPSLNTNENW